MNGYIIVQINVKNSENYKEYLQYVTPIASKYGGEYIVRAGNFEIMEGEWNHKRNVVIKFPSVELLAVYFPVLQYP